MTAQIVNMLDAKTSLSKLIHALEVGEAGSFIIARNGMPAARLMPLEKVRPDRSKRIGVAKGRFKVPADLDKHNAQVQNLFEGN
jgi:antitoxin (DNA-binding transcriptional repressor) of toxin-antitoxin stability system